MPRQRRPSQNWPWGPILPHVQNLGDNFVFFFQGDQNRNFRNVRGLKLLLNLINIYIKTLVLQYNKNALFFL